MYCKTDSIKMRETNKKNQSSKNKSSNQTSNVKKAKTPTTTQTLWFSFSFKYSETLNIMWLEGKQKYFSSHILNSRNLSDKF